MISKTLEPKDANTSEVVIEPTPVRASGNGSSPLSSFEGDKENATPALDRPETVNAKRKRACSQSEGSERLKTVRSDSIVILTRYLQSH